MPLTFDYPNRPLHCREALSGALCAIADQAIAMGWDKEEITVAMMEIANDWYFSRISDEAEKQIGDRLTFDDR
jgi:hypothetical protein